MDGHRLVRNPSKLKVRSGTAIGCTCGAVFMNMRVAVAIATHAKHVRQVERDAALQARADAELVKEAWI